jgi:N-acetylglucosamine-6-phosphate deacetylase
MPTIYLNGKVLARGRLAEGVAVVVENGKILELQDLDAIDAGRHDCVDLEGGYLLPGFIDTQVNGGGGVLFNDSPTLDGIKAIARAHHRFGTTGLLPTLISDGLDVVRQGMDAVSEAIGQAVPGVLGIHIEGPFLNVERRGVHDPARIRKLNREILADLQPLESGCTVLTVAPETLEPGMIRELTARGFRVCAGHSNATALQIRSAIDEGLRGFTHLYNAMSQLTGREPGVVGAALDSDEAWCGIIVDGHHLSPASVRIAYRCKGPQKLMLVTDAMPPVGSETRGFSLMGTTVTVKDGRCVDERGTLAGSALDMATALRNMIDTTGCSLQDASMMASASPAAFLGLHDRKGRTEAGMAADFVILDSDLQPRQTVIAGQTAWPR